MRILMKTTAASPEGSMVANQTYTVDDDTARELIDGGYAAEVEDQSQVTIDDPESAAIEPPEKAVKARARAKRVK